MSRDFLKLCLGIAILFAFWLLMSGVYKALTIGLGLFSCALVYYLGRRAAKIDGISDHLPLRPFAFLRYCGWLIVEITKANWSVAKIILGFQKPRPHFFSVPKSQKTDLGKVIFGNSITLTPGTITIRAHENQLEVHALRFEPSVMEDLHDMDQRIIAVEQG